MCVEIMKETVKQLKRLKYLKKLLSNKLPICKHKSRSIYVCVCVCINVNTFFNLSDNLTFLYFYKKARLIQVVACHV